MKELQVLLAEELGQLTAYQAAARLIGSRLVVRRQGATLAGRIVETEAYDQSDPASHSFRGLTERNRVMFGPAGVAYVYFTYGMHYCLNVVVGKQGNGAAVLIRALEPLSGLNKMMAARHMLDPLNLLNGPAKLTKALAIDLSHNGHDLSREPLILELDQPMRESAIAWTPRIGIREPTGQAKLWRACLIGSPYLSKRL